MFTFGGGNVIFFFQMRVFGTDLSLNRGSCEQQERREKGVLRAAHLHTPFQVSAPLPVMPVILIGNFGF